jgi:hypothetical protein
MVPDLQDPQNKLHCPDEKEQPFCESGKYSLEESAILYAELYAAAPTMRELTESALESWPESVSKAPAHSARNLGADKR